MKRFTTIPFLLAFLLFSANVLAQVQNYYVDTTLDENGNALVKLAITFHRPVNNLKFTVFGEVKNFQASTNTGPLNCSVKVDGVTNVDCVLSSIPRLRMANINFTTPDFVKLLDNKFYFNGDFTLNQNIDSASIFVRLPEGTIVDENATKMISPENSTMVSDGRRIIIVWSLSDIKADEPLRFQVLYELVLLAPLFRLRHFLIFGVAAAGMLGLIYIRYFRQPQKMILSVLDEYERRIMNLIINSEGVINQRKVVRETNLSKAKVSRVVKSLVGRGLIEVERIGRRNKLKLIKKKFKI